MREAFVSFKCYGGEETPNFSGKYFKVDGSNITKKHINKKSSCNNCCKKNRPTIINKKKNEIAKRPEKLRKPSGHTAHWIDLCSHYYRIRRAWILGGMRKIKTAKRIGIDLINFHATVNDMFYGQKRKMSLDNLIKSLREL